MVSAEKADLGAALRGRTRRLAPSAARKGTVQGRYVLYWMQQSQRARCNHALEQAVLCANELGLPVLVGFGLAPSYPEANLRHYRFLLEGLRETAATLAARGIGFALRLGAPDQVALELAAHAAVAVCDRGYLRVQRRWRRRFADEAPCPVIEVEADAVVPVEMASGKAEIAARTLRPKVRALWPRFLVPLPEQAVAVRFTAKAHTPPGHPVADLDPAELAALEAHLEVDRSVAPVSHLHPGGTSEALRRLHRFVGGGLRDYGSDRPRPEPDSVSQLSMYLHFGQIAPLEVALAARAARGVGAPDRDAFLEELLVRRELAQNFCWYVQDYDRLAAVPGWALATLHAHEGDPRPSHAGSHADAATLEAARSDDAVWNAAMREMIHTGYLHNRLRMYWGKKILEWSPTAEEAHRIALALNNKYLLDGRDPSSYANVAWIFGVHDRPFGERPVFGNVRSMTAAGLARKMNVDAYIAAAEARIAAGRPRRAPERSTATRPEG
jgi:deoxyribodipyrimidine photo-lyase